MVVLTKRDDEILDALTIRIRLLSLEQVTAMWWNETPTGLTNARKRLQTLVDRHMLCRLQVFARPLPSLAQPIAKWRPRSPAPCFGQVAWRLQSRWTKPPRLTTVYIATRRCANFYGGRRKGELTHEFQATHDLALAQLYLSLKRKAPQKAQQWFGEDMLRRQFRTKQPDAVIAESPTARPRLVVEFGGAYDMPRVAAFHKHCKKMKLPYEIW